MFGSGHKGTGFLTPMMKRVFDFVISMLGLIVLAPMLVAVAVAINVESAGPVFYRGLRAGRYGKPFRIFKFRTMVVNADKIGGPSTATDDPRITRVGSFLRHYKLDELPQLINVVRGEMSFVGPRPEVPQYVAMFSAEEKIILSVPPGITDWASILNSDEGAILAGSPDPEKTYLEKIRPEKIRLQLEYVRNQSFGTDIRILLETFKILLHRQRPIPQIDMRPRGGE
jgi:lipopolysaccharide/colanic/teichoic acid biosynthesis glycosyltransferase